MRAFFTARRGRRGSTRRRFCISGTMPTLMVWGPCVRACKPCGSTGRGSPGRTMTMHPMHPMPPWATCMNCSGCSPEPVPTSLSSLTQTHCAMPIQAFFLPQVRSIAFTQPLTWLALGWRDMVRAGAISVVHGVLLAALGMVIAAVAHDRFWLLAGALSGFLVVAPVLATSFYVLSRSLERGEPANAATVMRTWLFWQSSNRDTKWGNDYWCLVQFGALLALAA